MGNRKVVNETRVLVVEDEDAVRELLAVTLEGAGYTPLAAADVPEAEHLMGERAPELILLDWMLPGMSGIEFTRRLRREQGRLHYNRLGRGNWARMTPSVAPC